MIIKCIQWLKSLLGRRPMRYEFRDNVFINSDSDSDSDYGIIVKTCDKIRVEGNRIITVTKVGTSARE